tara:strand:+ start:7450 stop:8589 length:1140 start_codon:yes stop_codon:yes gene_type:complete
MAKILVTSDWHLSDRIWKHRPIEGDSYAASHYICDWAFENEVTHVIIAGDILDKQRNNSTAIHHLTTNLEMLTDAGVKIYFNQGQHCMQKKPWPLLVPGVVHLKLGDVHNVGGLMVGGFDFCHREQLQENLKSDALKELDVLVCHQVWQDFMGGVGNPQGCFADVPDNISTIITGDYHEAICQGYAGKVVISPGSTHMRSISEPVDKSFYVMDMESTTFARAVTIPTRQAYSITAFSTTEELNSKIDAYISLNKEYWEGPDGERYNANADTMPNEIRRPLIRIIHDVGSFDQGCQKVIAKYEDDAHFFYKAVKPTENKDLEILEHVDASDRLRMVDCLNAAVSSKDKPLVHSLATALLGSGEPENALKLWIKEQTDAGS